MNKLKMESLDMTKANIDKIAEIFPQVVTEVADPSGAIDSEGKPLLKKAIDFEKLKVVLSAGTGDYVVADDERERYEFTWVGKRQSMIDSATSIRKTLRPCPAESKDWATTKNLYIEGDNLEVLKLLQESYLGKVKMIYIDPPYNTGKDFIYKDNFAQSREEYEDELDMFDEEGNRLFQNTETNGRFHSDWCSMIYPRLQLARNLLTDDGVIFISIDDCELDNLTKISSEVFGVGNWLATLIWNKQHSQQQGVFKRYHESIIVFAKNANMISNIGGGDGVIEAGAQKKISKANPASEFTFPSGVRFDAPNGTIITGTYGDSEKSSIIKGRLYSVNGVTAEEVTISAGWTQKNQMLAYFNGETVYDTKGQLVTEFYFNSAGKIKCTKNRSKITPPTLLPLYGMVSEQTEALFKLMGGYFFDMPKPVNMLKDFWLNGQKVG